MMGVLAASQNRRSLGDLLRGRGRGLGRMHRQGPPPRFDLHHGHILGNGQIDRPGPFCLGGVKGVADHFGRRRWRQEGVGPLVTGLNIDTRSTT